MKGMTFGAEHEWGDWPLDRPLPVGYGRDTHDNTIVNSNGIANDPTGRLYNYGGEINTPPTDSAEGQVDCLWELRDLLPEAVVNYRSNLHVHVRIPSLREDLSALKQVQRYIHANLRTALAVVEPLMRPMELEYATTVEFEGALRRWRRRRVSHQTLLTPDRLARQLSAGTIDEFFRWEPPEDKQGRPLWHCQPRLAVNLRQLKETDTVEFRHFPGTLDANQMRAAVTWCQDFLEAAVGDRPVSRVVTQYHTSDFPPFPAYVHWQETRYRATVHDGTNTKAEIAANIRAIEEGTFDAEGPGCLPWQREPVTTVRRRASSARRS